MAWLSIRQQGGVLVLRMEDIDPERSRAEFADGILRDLAWLGITWDEGPDLGGPFGPYAQSERLGWYGALLEDLRRRGLVYPCYCTRKELRMLALAPHVGDEGAPYPGACRLLPPEERARREGAGRRPAMRLNTAAAAQAVGGGAGPLVLDVCDRVLGEQRFSLRDCGGDFAVRRSDGVVAYQLAVSADDAAMHISEVVRGDDLLPSTPRQLLLFRLLGREAPRYAHVPLLRDASGERLAKRHKSLEIAVLRDLGIAPRAIVGYLGFLSGCQDAARPAAPAELLPAFSLAALRNRLPLLPDDAVARMAALA